ncbi:hypothetical protein T261_0730 [Streptomyces lydicus]|nr:hypothetical protein T261_0730 [Streptomyces lydicus]
MRLGDRPAGDRAPVTGSIQRLVPPTVGGQGSTGDRVCRVRQHLPTGHVHVVAPKIRKRSHCVDVPPPGRRRRRLCRGEPDLRRRDDAPNSSRERLAQDRGSPAFRACAKHPHRYVRAGDRPKLDRAAFVGDPDEASRYLSLRPAGFFDDGRQQGVTCARHDAPLGPEMIFGSFGSTRVLSRIPSSLVSRFPRQDDIPQWPSTGADSATSGQGTTWSDAGPPRSSTARSPRSIPTEMTSWYSRLRHSAPPGCGGRVSSRRAGRAGSWAHAWYCLPRALESPSRLWPQRFWTSMCRCPEARGTSTRSLLTSAAASRASRGRSARRRGRQCSRTCSYRPAAAAGSRLRRGTCRPASTSSSWPNSHMPCSTCCGGSPTTSALRTIDAASAAGLRMAPLKFFRKASRAQ